MTKLLTPPTGYFVDHQTIGLPRRDMRHLESLVRSADWRVVVQHVSFLSTVESQSRMFQGVPFDDAVARQFTESALSARVLRELGQGGLLVNKFALAVVATAALRLGEEKDGDGKFPNRQVLGELLLTANDIATQDSGHDPDSPQALAALVRHLGVSSGETPFCRIARYYQLLCEIPYSLPRSSDWRDLRRLFRDATGFEIDRLIGLAFGIYSHYADLAARLNRRWRSPGELPAPETAEWILDSRTFLKNTRMTQEEAHELMLTLSTGPTQFREDPNRTDRPFDFTHPKTWPMVHLGDSRFCVPLVDWLFDRVAIRAYFDIIDSLATKEEKEAFGGFFGRVVERYVHLLFAEMLGEPAGRTGRWFKPESYQRRKGGPEGPDAVIIGHEDGSLVAIFVEVKSSRPTREVATSGDLKKLRDNWSRYLIGTKEEPKAARQLDRAIADFRAGALRLPDLDASQVAKIYPVIVTLDPWPFLLDVYIEFIGDVRRSGLLTGQGIAPLDVWSCFDLELLSPHILAGESLMETVKQRSKESAHLPMWLQISNRPGGSNPTSPLLSATWDRIHDQMVENLGLS